jgi:PilZ domain-containing protein
MSAPSQPRVSGKVTLTQVEWEDRRRRKRVGLSLPTRIRPFDPRCIHLEEVRPTLDFSRNGLYFVTSRNHYSVGMRVLLTFPYSEKAPIQREFLGKIVRIEKFPDGSGGIAVHFLF